jgi:hypothetical protein
MTYNNLENKITSVSATWSSVSATGLEYTTLGLSSDVPHVDQIEVERIFTLDAATQAAIDPYDLHRVFILTKTEFTLNTGTSKLTGFTIVSGARSYTCTRGALTGTSISIPSISSSDLVTIRRKTYSINPYVSWVPGTRLTSEQLNKQVQQLIRLNQEIIYKLDTEYVRTTDISGTSAPSLTINNDLNLNGHSITGLASVTTTIEPASTVAAPKGYVDTNFVNQSTAQTSIGGAKTFTGAMTLSSTLNVTGATTLSNNLIVDTDVLTANATTNRVGVGTTSPAGTLGVVSDMVIGNQANTGTSGTLRLISSSGVNYIQSGQAAAGASSATLVVSPYGGGAEFMRMQSVGVGIGSIGSSPVSRLHVHEAAAATAVDIRLTSAVTGATVADGLALRLDTGGAAYLWNYENTSLLFGTNATERMRIDNNGNVGIGTASPQAVLDLGSGTQGRAITWSGGTNANNNIFSAYSAGGLVLASGAAPSTSADAYVSPNSTSMGRAIVRTDGFGANAGTVQFYTNAASAITLGSVVTPTERMRITSAGRVGIGTTTPGNLFVVSNGGNEGLEFVPAVAANSSTIQSYNRTTTTYNNLDLRATDYTFKIGTTDKAVLNASGNFLLSGGTLGYTTGSGGTVTQLTSKSTPVTLNKPSGTITMFTTTSLAAGASVGFVLNNSLIEADDVIVANHNAGGGTANAYAVQVLTASAGSVVLRVTNLTGGALAEAVKINFAIFKAATT